MPCALEPPSIVSATTLAADLYDSLDAVFHLYGRHQIRPYFGEHIIWARARTVLERYRAEQQAQKGASA